MPHFLQQNTQVQTMKFVPKQALIIYLRILVLTTYSTYIQYWVYLLEHLSMTVGLEDHGPCCSLIVNCMDILLDI